MQGPGNAGVRTVVVARLRASHWPPPSVQTLRPAPRCGDFLPVLTTQSCTSWSPDFSGPIRPFSEADPPTVSCRLLTLKPKKSDDNITRDRAGSAANYHLTFWLSPAWGDHKKLIHLAQDDFKCSSPPWAARPPKKTACWVSEAGWEGEAG